MPCAAAAGSCTCRTRTSLFDLEKDPGEAIDVASQHPDVVARLMQHVEHARWDLGDALTSRTGRNVRPAGKLF